MQAEQPILSGPAGNRETTHILWSCRENIHIMWSCKENIPHYVVLEEEDSTVLNYHYKNILISREYVDVLNKDVMRNTINSCTRSYESIVHMIQCISFNLAEGTTFI